MDLARACAETVEVLDAYTRDGFALEEAAPDVSSMDEPSSSRPCSRPSARSASST
jgi:hypothetical protein